MKLTDVDPFLRGRLEQWARYSRGGLPSQGGSVWREDIYVGGQTARKLSAQGVATRAAVRIVTEEWPEPAVQIDRIMSEIIGHYSTYGREIVRAVLVYHSSDEDSRTKAQLCRMSKDKFYRRLNHGHDLVNRFLDRATDLA